MHISPFSRQLQVFSLCCTKFVQEKFLFLIAFQFTASEKKRQKEENLRLLSMQESQTTDFEARCSSNIRELTQLQGEKKRQLEEHESEKLKTMEERFMEELRLWKDQLSPREKVHLFLN